MLGIALALTSLVAPACISARYRPPEMPYTVTTASGTVHASSMEEAKRIPDLLEDLAPKVQTILGTKAGPSPEVTHVDGALPGRNDVLVNGGCYKPSFGTPYIVLKTLDPSLQGLVLTHELVHYFRGGVWDRLSPAVEEGLADEIAASLAPAEYAYGPLLLNLRRPYVHSVEDPARVLNMSKNSFEKLDYVEMTAASGVGFFVAHRLGVEALRTLCQAAAMNDGAHVSAAVSLEKAKLSPTDMETW